MNTQTLKQAGLLLYERPKCCNKWHLPVCASQLKTELFQLSPRHFSRWEDVDFDGCPTMCYVLTGGLVRSMNRAANFTSFFSIFLDCLGEGPVRRFFPDLWVRNNNIKALARNKWEKLHDVHTNVVKYSSMSVREAARRSIY